MVNALPIIKIAGKEYFLDARLREVRNVNDPCDRIDIEEILNHPISCGLSPEERADRNLYDQLEEAFYYEHDVKDAEMFAEIIKNISE